ncbi:TPA: ExbD/TolR family protein [Klebsiella michiganensis]|uniref:ExbD/TolR family protein n=1 Tax=Enterobacter hormaechei TaxID=158836 RepID=UPI003907EF33|nr:biopolymer transporter ExbD [Enterobacter hormaechei subsp. steigerwaltii]HAV1583976.1 biopolymer transporter ExbD [Enterobacter hormaechei subsp. steigerwaltii]HAV1867106.1 biopolymer transporter ExbD [Enterobacter hormaechei subsp. steigerwaltii]
MAMNVGHDSGDELLSAINTTPLVDVMLVLLIIFLITIPVATHTVPVSLPQQDNHPRQSVAQDVNITVTRDGSVFWNAQSLAGETVLAVRLNRAAQEQPQPVIHIHGDARAAYEPVGRVVLAAQRAGIEKLGFVTEPRLRN